MTNELSKSDRKWAIIIGIGLALFPIHNKWLADATAINGQATMFLPAIGSVIWILASLFFLRDNWKRVSWGDKRVFIPLIIIAVSISVSGMVNASMPQDKVAPMGLAFTLLGLYLVSRVLGPALFRALIPFALLAVIVSIVIEIVHPSGNITLTGGMITNSCASAGFIIFSAVVNQGKKQWIWLIAALIGVVFIGALEGIFILAVLIAVILLRRDVNRWILIIGCAVLVIAVASTATGILTPIYADTHNLGTLWGLITGNTPINTFWLDALTTGRWTINIDAIHNLQPVVGRGFAMTATPDTAHNIPLVIAQQVGVIAAVAWTFIAVFLLVKTKWKYMWITVIAMSLFDHFLWTQFLPWMFTFIGASAASGIKSDLIFRKKAEEATTL